ncbi:hypothetical protein BDQ17DRAFT_754888 [Cyathus striatus]|nr:hypothetical protein BDQ17DRAFT_754888 [Cyathus striatus]
MTTYNGQISTYYPETSALQISSRICFITTCLLLYVYPKLSRTSICITPCFLLFLASVWFLFIKFSHR